MSIVIAREPAGVAVPSVVGDDEASASATLRAAGLTPVVETAPARSPAQEGRVIRQDPPGGRRVRRGSSVTIVVGEAAGPPGGEAPAQPR